MPLLISLFIFQVQNLLQQMQSRFQTMSESIISKIDEMGNRIEELEQSVNELKSEMGMEGSPSPSAPPKVKIDPKSTDDSA
ncbi:Heat shock factor-binding protein 1 [Quillaja saponaria]|uniref:Heat shock factor-binding protein 1 n=1 Tax=Quillaja saponaria TaxID=32244 RepID=A0AAD7PHA6_QUISA|nr:Heat shock factor-binding protein 1 [Quillaja saponaria]